MFPQRVNNCASLETTITLRMKYIVAPVSQTYGHCNWRNLSIRCCLGAVRRLKISQQWLILMTKDKEYCFYHPVFINSLNLHQTNQDRHFVPFVNLSSMHICLAMCTMSWKLTLESHATIWFIVPVLGSTFKKERNKILKIPIYYYFTYTLLFLFWISQFYSWNLLL